VTGLGILTLGLGLHIASGGLTMQESDGIMRCGEAPVRAQQLRHPSFDHGRLYLRQDDRTKA
jgi:hypothetical protein